MRLAHWLKQAEMKLAACGILTGRLDSLILLEDCLKRDRAWLLANPDYELDAKLLETVNNLLIRRAKHEPLAYIRGKSEFYGREFYVNSSVLEPRPETESMIECLLALPEISTNWLLADVGTGSGAIGITAALELGSSNITLVDIDPAAIKVAKSNVVKFTLSLSTKHSDLITDVPQRYDVLLCNLPYIPDQFHINLAAGHEPRMAIFGGQDGLEVYRKLFLQVKQVPNKPLYILTESLPPQHDELNHIAGQVGYKLVNTADFIQVFKNS